MRLINLWIVGFLFLGIAQAQTQTTQDTPDKTDPICQNFNKADEILNETYQFVISKNANDTLFIEKIKEAQRAWVQFRDAEVAAIYHMTEKHYERGFTSSIYPRCYCAALEALTQKRAQELKRFLQPSEGEKDICR